MIMDTRISVTRRTPWCFAAAIVLAIPAWVAAVTDTGLDYSLMSGTRQYAPGSPVSVELVALNRSPYQQALRIPATVDGVLTCDRNRWFVSMKVDADSDETLVAPGEFEVVRLTFDLPVGPSGTVELTMDEPARMRAVLDVAPSVSPDFPGEGMDEERFEPSPFARSARPTAVAHLRNHYAANFSVYEPMYFLYGADAPAAKFQFSFRYQLAAEDGWLTRKMRLLRGVMFGYTQRSLWDIGADSSPFYDTSYIPELGYVFHAAEPDQKRWFKWLGWQVAFQHESNGRSGPDSRSLNVVFARPAFALGDLDGWHLLVAPKVLTYVDKSTGNHDIEDYRGYGELRFALGHNNGPAVAFTGRMGEGFDHGAFQIDLTIPTTLFSGSLASFFHLQYWNGYGESLRDYNVRSETTRLGISLVR